MTRLAIYLKDLAIDDRVYRVMSTEADNWRATMTWLQQTMDQADLALQLLGANVQFVSTREAVLWMERMLAHPESQAFPRSRAEVWWRLGFYQRIGGDLKGADNNLLQCLALCREQNFRPLLGEVLAEIGNVACDEGDVERARNYLLEALTIANELADISMSAWRYISLGEVEIIAENASEARRLILKAMETIHGRVVDYPSLIGWATNHMGQAALLEDKGAEAKDWIAQSIQAFETLGSDSGVYIFALAWNYHCLGEIALTESDIQPALFNFRRAIPLAMVFNDNLAVSWCLAGLAGALSLDKEPKRGAWLWGASGALRERMSYRIAPASRRNRERTVARLHEQLGEAEYARLIAEGRTWTLERAIEAAK